MLLTTRNYRTTSRRGVVLILVLGLLALFITVGVTFAVISKVEGQGARNFKRSIQNPSPPGQGPDSVVLEPYGLFQFGVAQLVFDTTRTNSAMRGHSLLRDMYASPVDDTTPLVANSGADPIADYEDEFPVLQGNDYRGAYNGSGLMQPRHHATPTTGTAYDPMTLNEIRDYFKFQRSLDADAAAPPLLTGTRYFFGFAVSHPQFPINFTNFQRLGNRPPTFDGDPATMDDTDPLGLRHPEQFLDDASPPILHFIGFDEDHDAPDFNTMFLALERADGQIVMPSFHRPYLIKQIEDAAEFTTLVHNPANNGSWDMRKPAWRDPSGRRVILRPRELEVNAGVIGAGAGTDRWRDLLDKDNSGYVGDCPEELDVDTDGDGLKDAIWIDLGYPVQTHIAKDGTVVYFKPLYAFKVLDLDGKINLNVHGNLLPPEIDEDGDGAADKVTGHTELHVSNLGASPTEVNPKHAMLLHDPLQDPSTTDDRDASGRLNQFHWRRSDPANVLEGPIQYQKLLLGNGIVRGRYNNVSGLANPIWDRPGVNVTDDNQNSGWYASKYHSGLSAANAPYPGIIDFFGSGRYYEPFVNLPPGMTYDAQGIHPHFVNYYRFGFNNWQLSLALQTSGLYDTSTTAPRVDDNWLTWDEADEVNVYSPDGSDSLFGTGEFEKLWRFGDIDASVLADRLTTLLPNVFGDPIPPALLSTTLAVEESYARQRMRRLVTSDSWDLVRFNMPPNMTDYSDIETGGSLPAGMTEDAGGMGGASPVRHYGQIPSIVAASPITETGRGLRLDLNRKLSPYINPTTGTYDAAADAERSMLARDFYILLYMASRPTETSATEKLAHARTLAQIAVNIVDMRDTDDAMTMLIFNETDPDASLAPPYGAVGDPSRTVFGFELPRLVISEAVAVVHDDQTKAWLFAELHSPWPNAEYGANQVPLEDAIGGERYQLRFTVGVAARDPGPWTPVSLSAAAATMGPSSTTVVGPLGSTTLPNYFLVGPPLSKFVDAVPITPPPSGVLKNWDAIWNMGGNGTGGNDFTSDELLYVSSSGVIANDFVFGLFRTRNPYDVAMSTTNAWVQIDHVKVTDGNGGYLASTTGIDSRFSKVRQRPWHGEQRPWDPQTPSSAPTPVNNEESTFAGAPGLSSLPSNQLSTSGFVLATNTNTHTFGQVPGSDDTVLYSLSFPFLNRDYASPLELLYVRLYGSHYWDFGMAGAIDAADQWRLRFTDDFEFTPDNGMAGARVIRDRRVPWFDDPTSQDNPTTPENERTRHPANPTAPISIKSLPHLFRFFEFVECHSRMNGATVRDTATPPDPEFGASTTPTPTGIPLVNRQRRVPGKINLNTITDEEIFRSLVDEPEAMPEQQVDPSGSPVAPQRIPTYYFHNDPLVSDFDWRRALIFDEMFSSASTLVPGLRFGSISGDPGFNPLVTLRSWPAIQADTSASPIPPGRYPYEQVHSELFRMFLLSRAGRDGVYGTGDDKPFRSFAAPRLSDTILRRRDVSRLDYPEGQHIVGNPGDPAGTTYGEYVQLDSASAGSATGGSGYWTPRLFDPVINPLPASAERVASISSTTPADRGPLELPGGFPDSTAVDSWMLEHEQNKLLAKIGGNVTTRSNVFAVWATVGYFKVEPGTETSNVPCLNEEIGIDTGANIRHRAFFIVDRSRAQFYNGPLAPGQEPRLEDIDVLTMPGKVRIIE